MRDARPRCCITIRYVLWNLLIACAETGAEALTGRHWDLGPKLLSLQPEPGGSMSCGLRI